MDQPRRKHATPKEVAEHLKTSSTQVLRWTHAGVIPTTVKEGKVYRYDLDEVDRVLGERACRAQKPKRID